ncbi:MAG: 8-hydroxy-5-deazaflavin:NADPH oxidoreductase [Actinomycetota bacterium]|nr:8-hydroxy-5-deazaflavin:NADPH oxidoreductase [Actinomycetota bacterium]
MKIAIIGAGNVGRALAGSISKAGYDVIIGSNTKEHAAALAAEVGGTAADSTIAAVAGADAVVLAIPYPRVDAAIKKNGKALEGKILIDVTNPLNATFSGLATYEPSGAELIQHRLPQTRVIKAFNTVFANLMTDPNVDGEAVDGLVAGDDEDAKKKVLELVGAIGFHPVDCGPLSAARVLENMAFLNIALQAKNSWSRRGSWKLLLPESDRG